MLVIVRRNGDVNALSGPKQRGAETNEKRRDEQSPPLMVNVRGDEQTVSETGQDQRHFHADQFRQEGGKGQIGETKDKVKHSDGNRSVSGVIGRRLECLSDEKGHEDQNKGSGQMNDAEDVRSIHFHQWKKQGRRKTAKPRFPLSVVLESFFSLSPDKGVRRESTNEKIGNAMKISVSLNITEVVFAFINIR